ncbi:DUF469 family protein [bacterium]|nr:DUF469 family protein [bacterium]
MARLACKSDFNPSSDGVTWQGRNQIRNWLDDRQDVTDCTVGELIDLWYGEFCASNKPVK